MQKTLPTYVLPFLAIQVHVRDPYGSGKDLRPDQRATDRAVRGGPVEGVSVDREKGTLTVSH